MLPSTRNQMINTTKARDPSAKYHYFPLTLQQIMSQSLPSAYKYGLHSYPQHYVLWRHFPMGLSNCTHLHLQVKGTTTVDDLHDFAKAGSWTQILDNYKHPPQAMAAGNIVNQPVFKLPFKSLMRLKVAGQAVEYYPDTGRALPASWMLRTNRFCNFQAKKESLDEMKKNNTNLDCQWSATG